MLLKDQDRDAAFDELYRVGDDEGAAAIYQLGATTGFSAPLTSSTFRV
jgi:hypothetical protein